MTTNTKRISEWIWNFVGVLSAILLLLYISTSFLGVQVDKLIPVSGGSVSLPQGTSVPTEFVTNTNTPSESPDAAPTETSTMQTPTPTNLATDTSTPSATPEPFPLVFSGYGPKEQYTLHKLQPGESYTFLAEMYDTTVEVLESLNFNKEGKRLWVGQYVVILPGLKEIDTAIPQFTVLILLEQTRLQDVAIRYGLSVDELRFYNLLSSDVTEVFLRVLLVPIQN